MSTSSFSSWGQSERCMYTCVLQDSYGRIIHPCTPAPFCNTMGQPYVYYTQVCNQKCPKRKEKRNCFVKAFKWYTQDFTDKQDNNSEKSSDIKGFAAWLDSKYCEFQNQKENEMYEMCHPLQSPRTSTTEATVCPPCPPSTTKKLPRLKSPWCKRKGVCKNAGYKKCKRNTTHASCEFILQPQNLTGVGSECCSQTRVCANKSNTTIVLSKETGEPNRCVAKSRSMTSICNEKLSLNDITVQKGTCKEVKKPLAPCGQVLSIPQADQECKIKDEMHSKPQNLPCQPCIIEQQQQVSQKSEIVKTLPCENQTIKQECQIKQEIRQISSNAQSLPFETCATQQQQVYQKSQILETSCNQNRMFQQECKIEEKTESVISISQKIETPHNECYIPEQESKSFRKLPAKSQKNIIPCDEDCTTQEECKFDQEMRQQRAKLQMEFKQELKSMQAKQPKNWSCHESCPTPHNCKFMKVIPCDQSCMGKKESIFVEDRQIPEKKLSVDRNICHKFCTTKEKCKFFEELLLRTSHRSSFQNEGQKPLKPNNTETLRELKECKIVKELPVPTQSRGTVVSCESICKKEQQYGKTEATIRPQKEEIICQYPELAVQQEYSRQILASKYTPEPCCKYITSEIPPTPVQVKPRKRGINVECQCPEESPIPTQVKPTKRQMDIECQCPPEQPIPVQAQTKRRTVDIDCQYPENKTTSTHDPYFKCILVERQPIREEVMLEESCQYSQKDLLRYDNKCCQYNRSDFESSREIVCSGSELEGARPTCSAQRTDSCTMKNLVKVRKVTRSLTIFRCDGVQTSDHSISLENDGDQDYAFFMRIICADKLNDCPCNN